MLTEAEVARATTGNLIRCSSHNPPTIHLRLRLRLRSPPRAHVKESVCVCIVSPAFDGARCPDDQTCARRNAIAGGSDAEWRCRPAEDDRRRHEASRPL
jgi:hypothetical protein